MMNSDPPKPVVSKLALIGIGLIGSSVALAARAHHAANHIVISTRRAETLARAEALGLGDSYHESAAEAVADADLVILSVPVGASGAVTEQIAGQLKPGAIISDVGSVKASVIGQMHPHLPPEVHFVPAHPIAGTERSGPDAGFATLFKDRWCILTPIEQNQVRDQASYREAVQTLIQFWQRLGSQVEEMTPDHHDRVLAIVSHLPHLIAYNLVGTASDLEMATQSEVIKYSASGFRDFTRLSASDPTMWRDVCLNNKDSILEMLARFSEDLSALQRAIRWEKGDVLFDLFSRTRSVRHSIIEAGQESAAVNFGRDEERR